MDGSDAQDKSPGDDELVKKANDALSLQILAFLNVRPVLQKKEARKGCFLL